MNPSQQNSFASAARAGQNDVCKYLIENGAGVGEAGYGGMQPLHHAINHMREATCEVLLELGANPNAGDAHGRGGQTGVAPDGSAAAVSKGC